MSLDVLKARLKENKISGVYLFCGPEEYTKDHYARLMRKNVESSPLPEFNHIFFSASTGKISELDDAVTTVPFMWDNKLIEITDLEDARISESDIEDYARIFSELPDYVTVLGVLRADESTEEARNAKSQKNGLSAFCATVKDHGLVVEFETEKADKLVAWITRHFNSSGVKFEPAVPREIISICGSDMYILQSEILKLTEVFDGTPITPADVKKYCCANSAYKYFDIATALNRRDAVGAKRILDSLDLSRDTLPMAVGLLAKNYSEMLLVKTAIDSGKGLDAIARELKIPQWRVGKIAQSVSQTDLRAIAFAINQLSAADLKLKSFRGNPQRILELTFYRICTYGRKAQA